jgi:hypothetical protein
MADDHIFLYWSTDQLLKGGRHVWSITYRLVEISCPFSASSNRDYTLTLIVVELPVNIPTKGTEPELLKAFNIED